MFAGHLVSTSGATAILLVIQLPIFFGWCKYRIETGPVDLSDYITCGTALSMLNIRIAVRSHVKAKPPRSEGDS
jgi:hypothetical protein